MNHARVAALLRELADEIESAETPAPADSRPRAKKARRPRALTRPDRQVSDIASALADAALKKSGFT